VCVCVCVCVWLNKLQNARCNDKNSSYIFWRKWKCTKNCRFLGKLEIWILKKIRSRFIS